MTDPLTARELVERTHEYVEKLTKECSKSLLEEYSRTHRKFSQADLPSQISADVVQWFAKRDRNLKFAYESANSVQQSGNFYLRFRGSTKDADFVLTAAVVTFSVPYSGTAGGASYFVKSLSFAANKNEFTRRK